MELPVNAFDRLLDAFYHAHSPEDFLKKAGQIFSAEFLLEAPPGHTNLPEYQAQCSLPVIEAGMQVFTLFCEGLAYEKPDEALRAVAFLLQKGVSLHNWFCQTLGMHPNAFLSFTPPEGGGLFCLYIPIPAQSPHVAAACDALAARFQALNRYMERSGFSLLLQCAPEKQTGFWAELSLALEAWDCIAGVSGPFANAQLAQGCMEKAKEAAFLQTGGQLPRIRNIKELRFGMFCRRAMQSLERQAYRLDDFLQYALKRILLHDKAHGTRYYESMYCYLLHGKNLKLAAQALSIHRNTLDYRISRIGELFQIDFEDRHICFEILFSCKLYEGTGACL